MVLENTVIIFVIVVTTKLDAAWAQMQPDDETTTPRDRLKLLTLTLELAQEAKARVHQIDGLRDTLAQLPGFQPGMILGEIREKYKTMLELYRQTANKYYGDSAAVSPALVTRRPVHYALRMEYVAALEIEIDRLVSVLESAPEEGARGDPYNNMAFLAAQAKKRPQLRTEDWSLEFARDEQLKKKRQRQKYLTEKLGRRGLGSGVRGTFYRQWPVDGSWTLDRYNYL